MPTIQTWLALLGLGGLSFTLLQNRQSPVNLQSGETLILTLANPIGSILQQFEGKLFPSREDKAVAIRDALIAATTEWHAPVHSLLNPLGIQTKSFWVTNKILVQDSTPAIEALIKTFDSSISIGKNVVIPLFPTDPIKGTSPNGIPQWNVNKTGAPFVWGEGVTGAGVVVATIDTGVLWTHEALEDGFIGVGGKNGWFDPILNTKVPNDRNGHGTHTMGTICGNNGIGVAPNATWMACLACETTGCPTDMLIACGQWLACPPPDCKPLPRVVSNSWGGGHGDDFFNEVIEVWHENNIVPVFAIGNSGPKCATANSPGDQEGVISVGSTDISDAISGFSSRGPNANNIVPSMVAPGSNINSASFIANDAYRILSGTSMATPHVAGAVALMLSKNPNLTFEQIEDLLFQNTNTALSNSGPEGCGDIPDDDFPNDVFGHGGLRVDNAVSKMK